MLPSVIDGHNDALWALRRHDRSGRSFLAGRPDGHLDLDRARAGGLAAGLFAVFVESPSAPGRAPQPPLPPRLDPEAARSEILASVALLHRLARASAGRLEVVTDVAALERCVSEGQLGAVLHLEGADGIDADLDLLEVLHAAGLRSLGLVWSRPNPFAEGVPRHHPASPDLGGGLTALGRALVRAANGLGVLVDLAHLNERGFWDVAALSSSPLVSSHTAAHTLSPAARNLTDAQLDAVGASGGLVGLTFHVGDLRPDGRQDPDTPLDVLAEHLEHIAARIGVEHVGLGSDFDGALIPTAIGDAAGLPRLLGHLRGRGWDDDALSKLAHGNWLRVLTAAWAPA